MGSKLSSLLVHEGLLPLKTLEDAIALQAIRGGQLDTVLLEKKLVSEATLLALASQVTECPPADPELFQEFSPEGRRFIDAERAQRLSLCPVRIENRTLVVLISETTDYISLEDLAFEVERRLLPFVTLEARLVQAQHLVYGIAPSPRFTKLLQAIGTVPARAALLPSQQAAPSASRPPLIIEPTRATDRADLTPKDAPAGALPGTSAKPAAGAGDIVVDSPPHTPPAATEPGELTMEAELPPPLSPHPPRAAAPPTQQESAEAAEPEVFVRLPRYPTAAPAEMPPLPAEAHEPASPYEELVVIGEQDEVPPAAEAAPPEVPADDEEPVEVSPESTPAPVAAPPHLDQPQLSPDSDERTIPGVSLPFLEAEQAQPASAAVAPLAAETAVTGTPLALEEAVVALHAASSREELLLALARGIHLHTEGVQLYVFKDGALHGQLEIQQGRIIQRQAGAKHILPLDTASVVARAAEAGSLYLGPLPDTDASAAVLARVGILNPISVALLPVVLRHKTVCMAVGHSHKLPISQKCRGPLGQLSDEASVALANLIVQRKQTAKQPPPAASESATAGPTSERSLRDPLHLLHALEEGGAIAVRAEETLRELDRPAIMALVSLFPGKLLPGVSARGPELPPVTECSTLLRALAIVGRPVLSAIVPLLVHPDPVVRFFATYLLSALVYPEAVALLARQLRDADPEVRRIAVRVLWQFRELEQFPEVLEELRNDLANPDPRPRRGAAEALGALGDKVAVPALVELLSDPEERVAAAAESALGSLTKQAFGRDQAQWSEWWEHNQQRDRIEWLIDGLVQSSPSIRDAAAAELEELTGRDFGYRAELSAEEREVIRLRYLEWWSLQE